MEKAKELNLTIDEQSRLADYIRECEIEREVSRARRDALYACQAPPIDGDMLAGIVILTGVFATLLGYSLGKIER